ncbi:UvdE-domain-containing protein [Acaromyces ingoldii]|uniref:UvdE-domain-containing protein n=1 Tax=Acaromyces ingoldii TaxID=215250 RepID=A0A316YAW3_9BASI|nr:UvdE-domain-containing protein [Acaromyces ingoldii]PWN86950.1 UvdE-domain-containing protein [Acaromyces ingoldii]
MAAATPAPTTAAVDPAPVPAAAAPRRKTAPRPRPATAAGVLEQLDGPGLGAVDIKSNGRIKAAARKPKVEEAPEVNVVIEIANDQKPSTDEAAAKGGRRHKVARGQAVKEEAHEGIVHEEPPKRRARKAAIVEKDDDDDYDVGLDDGVQDGALDDAPKKKKTKKSRAAAVKTEEPGEDNAAEAELDSDGEPVRRDKNGRKIGKRKRKPKEPIVYEIPPVPHRDFRLEGPLDKRAERANGFTGRLGYACLNTVLRAQDPPKFCSRNVRIKTIEEKGMDWVFDLARQNVRDIVPLLEFNHAHGIHMMRLSSEIFPFASHEKYGYDIGFAAAELREAGDVARRLDQRLTMHPGQFCQLGTPRENVLAASIRELEVHARVLDLMGVGPDGVMILHGGGTYGDQAATLERIRHTIEHRLPANVRARLVLENDEMSYSAEELLPLCESLDPPVPLIFDFHHDALRPSSLSPREIIERAKALFARRGITPKYHLSEPRPGARNLRERRAHSDRCAELPEDLPADAHLMLECKDKEQGVLEMYRIYNLRDVPHDSLRPPADDLTTATGGRRSKLDGSGGASSPKKKKKKGAAGTGGEFDGDENGEPAVDEKSKVERAIEKAKANALKRGIEYKGPKSQEDRLAARGPLLSAREVMEDMRKQADWVRAELRAGRERRPYPGTEIEAEAPEPDEGTVVE